MIFGWKGKEHFAPLMISTGTLEGIPGDVPFVSITGTVPPGSEGNSVVGGCFNQMSQAVDIQSSTQRLLVYDMTHLRYEFGDHLGAFFWNLPTLLDGVAILVAATGATRRNLESLQEFIGAWLPVGFYDSLDAISAHVRDSTESIQVLSQKSDACSQRDRIIAPNETGVTVVLLGSRQTGQQYRTYTQCREDSDLDCGVVGGPKELAVLTMKMSNQPGLVPNVGHPPIKTYSSVKEATAQGLLAILPKTKS